MEKRKEEEAWADDRSTDEGNGKAGETELASGDESDEQDEETAQSVKMNMEEEEEDGELDGEIPTKILKKGDKSRSVLKKSSDLDIFDYYEFAEERREEESESVNIDRGYSCNQSNDNQKQSSSEQEVAGQWRKGDHVCSALVKKSRRFICVDYPGVVKNKDKAVATLGGKEGIGQALSKNIRMELNYRPKDAFCKPTLSKEQAANNMLISVKRRRVASSSSEETANDGFEYKTEVLGVIEKMVDFTTPCDFQYLPLVPEKTGEYREILSSIEPDFQDDKVSYLSRPTPLFIPPVIFSRKEMPMVYQFEDDVAPGSVGTRKKRGFGSIVVEFGEKGVPTEPSPVALKNMDIMCSVSLRMNGIAALKTLFERRPVWTKTALETFLTRPMCRQLQLLLPVVAYHFSKGPWAKCWCRFGYDPRKRPQAKIYQVVDWRLRSTVMRSKFEHKRRGDYRTPVNFRKFFTSHETSLPQDRLPIPAVVQGEHLGSDMETAIKERDTSSIGGPSSERPQNADKRKEVRFADSPDARGDGRLSVIQGTSNQSETTSYSSEENIVQEGSSKSKQSSSPKRSQHAHPSTFQQLFASSNSQEGPANRDTSDGESLSHESKSLRAQNPSLSHGSQVPRRSSESQMGPEKSSEPQGFLNDMSMAGTSAENPGSPDAVESVALEPEKVLKEGKKVDLLYMFFPDKIPPFKQMIYQICDIFEDEVQRKAHENDGKETKCTSRDGWCVPDFTDLARDILSQHVDRLLVEAENVG